jgi:hypothetical protein
VEHINIGKIPVGQWFPNDIRGKIRIRHKKVRLSFGVSHVHLEAHLFIVNFFIAMICK